MSKILNNLNSSNVESSESLTRIVVGLAVIIASINMAIIDSINLSYPILIGSFIVLTGIASWDPVYAFFRSVFSKNKNEKFNFSNTATTAA